MLGIREQEKGASITRRQVAHMKKFFSSLSGVFLLIGSLIWVVVLAIGIHGLINSGPVFEGHQVMWVGLPPLMYAMSLIFHLGAEKQ